MTNLNQYVNTFTGNEVSAIQFQYDTEIMNEIEDLLGENLVKEQREGIGAVGWFVKTKLDNFPTGSTILSNKDWVIVSDGFISVLNNYDFQGKYRITNHL